MGIIYCAENLVNGKKYIGQTTIPLEARKQRHFNNAFKYNKIGRFYDALREHGELSFSWTILQESVYDDNLDDREIFFIAENKSFGNNGYNMTEGGTVLRGYHHTQKTKDKIGKSLEGKSNLYHYTKRYGEEGGKIMYEKYIKDMKEKRTGKTRLSSYIEKWGIKEGERRYNLFIDSVKNTQTGKKHTDETKKKMSESLKGIKRSEEFKEKLRNRVYSKEHREKIGNAHRGKIISEETKQKWRKSREGFKHSAESKNKISESLKNKKGEN